MLISLLVCLSKWCSVIRALLTFLTITFPLCATAAEMRLVPGAVPGINYITVLGTFELGDDQKFIQIALPLDKAIVAFNSDGGNLSAGLGIGRAIRLKEFTTMVPKNSICASACGLAWLGGFERLVDEGAQVGFHAAYITDNGTTQETGMGNALAGAYLNQLGLTQSAIAYVTEAGPQNMKWLTAEDAKNVGIAMTVLASIETEPAPKTDHSPTIQFPEKLQTSNLKRVQSADIYGFDLPRMPLKTTTMEACELACQSDGNCKAYTFNRPNSACFLKSNGSQMVGTPLSDAGYKMEIEAGIRISRITVYEGIDLPGSDFENFRGMSFEQCMRSCEYDKHCAAFTFDRRGMACWLKSFVPATNPNNIAISGIKGVK
jgi:ATP-dependent protease ClpP protease subunit